MAVDLSMRTFGPTQCDVCGSPFTKRSPRSRYCGEGCKVIARRENANSRAANARRDRAPIVHQRDCRRCANGFATTNPYGYYCRPCVDAAERSGRSKYQFLSRKAQLIPEHRTCGGCGNNFRPSHVAQKYCGQSCKARLRRSSPQGRLNSIISCSVRRGLRNGKEGRSWKDILPYSLVELTTHLERQFLPGMSWGNIGEWHIDHRRPLNSFIFDTVADEEFQAAWALTNLQPMWATDNIRKGARLTCLL